MYNPSLFVMASRRAPVAICLDGYLDADDDRACVSVTRPLRVAVATCCA